MPLYPRADWTMAIPATDLSGISAIVSDLSNAYFAYTDASGVTVGCVDLSGTLQWLFQDPRMVTQTASYPTLALGQSELYLAYGTTDAIPGATNGKDTFTLCGNCSGPQSGYEDIVVARIDNLQTSPTLTWITQDTYLNSCNRETAPRLWYDAPQSRILLVYECSGATLCKNPIGTSNIVLAALDLNGGLSWAYQEELLNGPGANQSPSLTTDLSGNIYVAYTITQSVQGVPLQGSQDIEVVKLRAVHEGCNIAIQREWILSSVSIINSTGINASPSISCDASGVIVTFTTTGQVPGGIQSATRDIVFAGLTPSGILQWIQQDPYFNEDTYRYQTVDSSQTVRSCTGDSYTISHATDLSGSDMIVQWRTNRSTGGPEWLYNLDVARRYRSYIPVARFFTPFAAQTVETSLSIPAMSICNSLMFVIVNNYTINTVWIFGISQQEPFSDFQAFQYALQSSKICAKSWVCSSCAQ